MVRWPTAIVITAAAFGVVQCTATHWLDKSKYPKNYDDLVFYVTDPAVRMTGERALTAGCGADGRPYKYRGKNHIPELRTIVQGEGKEKVWIGAVDATTPWVFTNGLYVYQVAGMVNASHLLSSNVVRLPGNNAFLCSLHCDQVAFVLLQGNNCACLKTKPELRPVSSELFRCPGTYEEFCGTASSFTVYRNMLARSVKWARLVDRARYHGNKAYLYKSAPSSDQPLVSLRAEDDPEEKKGYVCNDTVFSIGPKHLQHLWVAHAPTSAVTWRQALETCMNQGRQLMLLPRDAKDCVGEVESQLLEGRSYWVGLSRQNEAVWMDGTRVQTYVNHHHEGQAACLTMSFTSLTPTFTFESCTGISLPVLCERNARNPLHTFTHDAERNHISTATSDLNGYSRTVSALVAVLVVLSLLTMALLLLLYHRDKWIPRKSPSSHRKNTSGVPIFTTQSSAGSSRLNKGHRWEGPSSPRGVDKDHVRFCSSQISQPDIMTEHSNTWRFTSAGASNGNPQPQLPLTSATTGSHAGSRLTGTSCCYTEVDLPQEGEGASQTDLRRSVHAAPTEGSESVTAAVRNASAQRTSSVRILDYHVDSSQSSATGSDEAYSVLGYRRSLLNAWSDVKRTAYAHVMIDRPIRGSYDDHSALYDVARMRSQRMHCIDNDYDHTHPRMVKNRSLSYPSNDNRVVLEVPGKCNESDV